MSWLRLKDKWKVVLVLGRNVFISIGQIPESGTEDFIV